MLNMILQLLALYLYEGKAEHHWRLRVIARVTRDGYLTSHIRGSDRYMGRRIDDIEWESSIQIN